MQRPKSMSLMALAVVASILLIGQEAAAQAPMMQSVDPALLDGLSFRHIGPSQGGRVTTVTGVPSQPRTIDNLRMGVDLIPPIIRIEPVKAPVDQESFSCGTTPRLASSKSFDSVSAGSAETLGDLLGAKFGHTCAITEDGTLFCWGANDSGQLGDSTTQPTSIPTRIAEPNIQATGTLTGNHAAADSSGTRNDPGG